MAKVLKLNEMKLFITFSKKATEEQRNMATELFEFGLFEKICIPVKATRGDIGLTDRPNQKVTVGEVLSYDADKKQAVIGYYDEFKELLTEHEPTSLFVSMYPATENEPNKVKIVRLVLNIKRKAK